MCTQKQHYTALCCIMTVFLDLVTGLLLVDFSAFYSFSIYYVYLFYHVLLSFTENGWNKPLMMMCSLCKAMCSSPKKV